MRRCVFCGGIRRMTNHHVGGRNFIAWFTMPLCASCQEIFHARQRAAGIDLRSSPNVKVRLIRALKMGVLFVWLLLDMLEREITADIERAGGISRLRKLG